MPRRRNAALWIAGDSVCSSGHPRTPRKLPPDLNSALQPLVIGFVLKELVVAGTEGVVPLAVREDVIGPVPVRRIQRGLKRRETRRADRSRRKPRVPARVVGGVDFQIRPGQRLLVLAQ